MEWFPQLPFSVCHHQFTMRFSYLAFAGLFVALASPLPAQVPDSAAILERLRQELQSGRVSPEEVRARIRAAGLTDQDVRRRLRELGYPESLLDRYLGAGVAPAGAPSLSGVQLEQVLRRLSVPDLGGRMLFDSLALFGDTLAADTVALAAGLAGLPVFGRSLFERATTQFQPVTMGPVPPNYRLGPGDELVLILSGDVEEIYTLPITREGYAVIPNVGRVSVNGLTMAELRSGLFTYLGRVYSGVMRGPEATTFFDVSIATLRRNQVFVIGEVEKPAAYEVTSVATALQALYQAAGPTEQGSFRNIQIRRGDQTIAVLDIYEYLTRGAATGDISLDQGDVVFVPVRGRRATVDGNVVRPGVYELKEGEGLRALMDLAGGIEPEADLRRVQIDRILPPSQRELGVHRALFDVNVGALLDREGEFVPLEPGDKVYVFAVSEERRNTVTIRGNIWSPGVYERTPEMRLSDLIDKAGGLKDDTYLGRAQIVRLDPLDLSQSVVAIALTGEDDTLLQEYDEVVVYSVADFRERRFVTIYGEVQRPGVYEFQEEMTLRDLVMIAGGLLDNAYVLEAEVARIADEPDETGDLTEVRTVALDSTYVFTAWVEQRRRAGVPPSNGDGVQATASDFTLQRYDNVFIRRVPGWELQRTVTVTGEVGFPGVYALQRKDERLSDVIERAGGLTSEAYEAAVRFFRRQKTRGQEGDTLSRVNVDLPKVLGSPEGREDLILMDGDSIHIPEYLPTVRVEGAVLFPVSVLYEPGASLDYYVENAGGYARDGDKGRTRVEYANGSVRTVNKFLIFRSKPRPGPGSRVFVPAQPESPAINWQAVTAVLTTSVTVYALLRR